MAHPEIQESPESAAEEVDDFAGETDTQRRSRRAAVIWLVCFVGGIYLLAIVMGLWLWLSGRLSF